MNERQTVFELLKKIELEGAYSGIALDEALGSAKHGGFVTALFYGVLERKLTLDFIIRQNSSREFDSLTKEVVILLRMGLYQLLYMNVPESAAVNETVSLSPGNAKGFVNAVLRAFLRGGKKIDTSGLDELHRLSVEYSCPAWIVKGWRAQFGDKATVDLLSASLGRPPVYARANPLKCTAEELCDRLCAAGFSSEIYGGAENCIKINSMNGKTGIKHCEPYKKGLFHIQDLSSQLYCRYTGAKRGETILDMCAAPGGKSFTVAENMNNEGRVLSFDLHENRTGLIRGGAERLGLSIIEARQNDALVFNERLPKADRVLCDVPCSGLGVIRRKPEIKYRPKAELAGLPDIQKKILLTSAAYVKPGGYLIYSTCTLRREENEDVARAFLNECSGFSPQKIAENMDFEHTFSVNTDGDGFYMAMFRKGR